MLFQIHLWKGIFLLGIKVKNNLQRIVIYFINCIYLNNYILSKTNLYFCCYIQGFAAKHTVVPAPSSFGLHPPLACHREARLTKCAYGRREPISSTGSDTLRERLHFYSPYPIFNRNVFNIKFQHLRFSRSVSEG